MRGTTHIAAGAATGLTYAQACGASLPETIAITACATLGGLLPDIDRGTSKLGKLIAPASYTIELLVGHRRAFHGIIPYLTGLLISYHFFPDHLTLLLALFFGICSHLLLDIFNPYGITLFWPERTRVRIPLCESGGICDKIIGFLLLGLCIWLCAIRVSALF